MRLLAMETITSNMAANICPAQLLGLVRDIFESNTTLDVEDTKKARIVSINQIQFDTIDRSSTYSLSV